MRAARVAVLTGSVQMSSVQARWRRWAVTAAVPGVVATALALGTGCDCRATVTAKSPVLGDVRVQLEGSGSSMCAGAPSLGDFEVYRGESELVWAAAFKASSAYPKVSELRYGTPPLGFTEEKPATPLAVNDRIEFRVHGPGFRGGVSLVVTAP